MPDKTKGKIKAVGKIVYGTVRVGTGIATATGHGILGAYLKSHHMQASAINIGLKGIDAGMKSLSEGWNEWEKS